MQAFEREVDAGDAGPPLRGKPFRRAVARSRQPPDNKKGRQAMLNEQPKRWRQASLIVFATTVILILPNLNSLIR